MLAAWCRKVVGWGSSSPERKGLELGSEDVTGKGHQASTRTC